MRINRTGAYLMIAAVLAVFAAALIAVVSARPAPAAPADLIQPIVALVALTVIVAVLMGFYRNVAVIRGAVPARYFRGFTADPPAEWVERPARAYMNLLELPVLFYIVCLLMLTTGKFNSVQVSLAWVFVAARCAHAFIHIAFNYVPLRFAAFVAGVVTLAVIWTRFAEQNLR